MESSIRERVNRVRRCAHLAKNQNSSIGRRWHGFSTTAQSRHYEALQNTQFPGGNWNANAVIGRDATRVRRSGYNDVSSHVKWYLPTSSSSLSDQKFHHHHHHHHRHLFAQSVTVTMSKANCSLLHTGFENTRWGIITGTHSVKWQNFITTLFVCIKIPTIKHKIMLHAISLN